VGGFLYVPRTAGEDLKAAEGRYRGAIQAFLGKGVSLKDTLVSNSFFVFVFEKALVPSENVLRLENGDFVVSAGTLFYRGRMGREALRNLYDDFLAGDEDFANTGGQYAILLFRDGRLWVFNDFNGNYAVFHALNHTVVSTSFLAAVKCCPSRTVSEQDLYEYLLIGAVFGNRTWIREVGQFDARFVHRVLPDVHASRKKISLERFPPGMPLEQQVDQIAATLVTYYTRLKSLFGDSITTALTGGFDSRITLAAMRRVGIHPSFYVYGGPNSPDVRSAQVIAKGEGIEVECYDKNTYPVAEPDQFAEITLRNLYFFDGVGHQGAFDSGADLHTRRARVSNKRLQINSVIGEVLRQYWMLPDRPIRVSSWMTSFYQDSDFSLFASGFDRKQYLNTLTDKAKEGLETNQDVVARDRISELFLITRMRAWGSPNNTANNLLSHALTPYCEPHVTLPCLTIPGRYKKVGLLEIAVIKKLYPSVAKYPSTRGYDFVNPVPLKYRFIEWAKVHTPIHLRPYLRWRRALREVAAAGWPWYLTPRYTSTLFDLKSLEISRYVHLDKVMTPLRLSRALTAELVLTDRF